MENTKKLIHFVPKDIVEKAFSYMLRYSDSTNTRGAFLDLINKLEEKNNKEYYINRITDTAMIQDINYNLLYSADAMEQYLQFRGLEPLEDDDLAQKLESGELYGFSMKSLFDSNGNDSAYSPSTFIRKQPKIGRNAPCPCGSGKNFKKFLNTK